MRRRSSLLIPSTALLSLGLAASAALGGPATAAPRSSEPAREPATYTATVETPPNFDDEAGGDADDPAIWVRRDRPAQSIALGALKNGWARRVRPARPGRPTRRRPTGAGRGPGRGPLQQRRHRPGTPAGDIAVVTDRGRGPAAHLPD